MELLLSIEHTEERDHSIRRYMLEMLRIPKETSNLEGMDGVHIHGTEMLLQTSL